jgi:hypothetical protein
VVFCDTFYSNGIVEEILPVIFFFRMINFIQFKHNKKIKANTHRSVVVLAVEGYCRSRL